ncbi:MAG: hypothetical protein RQ757_01645 [Pseudomonadales bacterium]|nr:hypothetical protein [Pseudomonadales bacterium]
MRSSQTGVAAGLLFLVLASITAVTLAAERGADTDQQADGPPRLQVLPVPDNGIQPRLVQAANGDIHLLYFRKRMADRRNREGDLYYRQFNYQDGSWGLPVRVSSGSYAHLDAIGRAAMAIDGSGRLHVVWYQDRPQPAYFYTRSDTQRTRFEPARSMVTENLLGVDAGADITASKEQVVISWAAGDLMHEDQRAVFMRRSDDGGASFAVEQRISDPALGACACCSLAVDYRQEHELLLGYRSAIANSGRHMQIAMLDMSATDPVPDYRPLHPLQRWELSACPVTTNDLLSSADYGTWMVYEMQNKVLVHHLPVQTNAQMLPPAPFQAAEPLSQTRQKHPAISLDASGQMLVAWGEGIGYTRGGALNLAVFNAQGKRLDVPVPELVLPDFSFPAVASLPDNQFLLLY